MGLNHNTSIVLDGLILAFDAANPKSYPGSGSTWFNLATPMKNNGILVASPTYTNSNSLVFNGTSQYVSLGTILPDATAFTWSAWIKTTTTVNQTNNYEAAVIIGTIQASGDSNDGLLLINNGTLRWYDEFNASGGGTNYNSTKTVNDNIWHHVAVTRNGASLQLYVDGELSYNTSTGGTQGLTNARGMEIGKANWTAGTFYSGSISIVQIYNKQLNAQEINQNFIAFRGRYGV
jgi:hypothetical protein